MLSLHGDLLVPFFAPEKEKKLTIDPKVYVIFNQKLIFYVHTHKYFLNIAYR